jgi:hypothetical protein
LSTSIVNRMLLFSLGLQGHVHPLLAGGASAFVTTVLYQPLDFLKTQIQEPKHE